MSIKHIQNLCLNGLYISLICFLWSCNSETKKTNTRHLKIVIHTFGNISPRLVDNKPYYPNELKEIAYPFINLTSNDKSYNFIFDEVYFNDFLNNATQTLNIKNASIGKADMDKANGAEYMVEKFFGNTIFNTEYITQIDSTVNFNFQNYLASNTNQNNFFIYNSGDKSIENVKTYHDLKNLRDAISKALLANDSMTSIIISYNPPITPIIPDSTDTIAADTASAIINSQVNVPVTYSPPVTTYTPPTYTYTPSPKPNPVYVKPTTTPVLKCEDFTGGIRFDPIEKRILCVVDAAYNSCNCFYSLIIRDYKGTILKSVPLDKSNAIFPYSKSDFLVLKEVQSYAKLYFSCEITSNEAKKTYELYNPLKVACFNDGLCKLIDAK